MQQETFDVVEELGFLKCPSGGQLRFAVEEFKGFRYGSVRRFSPGPQGEVFPTLDGITMGAEIVSGVLLCLSAKTITAAKKYPVTEMGKFAKRRGEAVVVRFIACGKNGELDLRYWREEPPRRGWSRKGIRLYMEDLSEIKKMLKAMKRLLSV